MNQDQIQPSPSRPRRFSVPVIVPLLSLAARLLLLIPGLSGPPGSDPMTRISITGAPVQALINLPANAVMVWTAT